MRKVLPSLQFAILMAAFGLGAAPRTTDVTEIRLKRTPCFGTCPVDELILRADGTVTYVGTRFVKRVGTFRGKLGRQDFVRLAELLRSGGFYDLKDRYDRPISDQSTVILSSRWNQGEKRVENYGESAPMSVWGFQQAVRGVVADVVWQKVNEDP